MNSVTRVVVSLERDMIAREFEIKFVRQNILSGEHETKYDFFTTTSESAAKKQCWMKYGDVIDIILVEEFK